jgi:O-antigen ligase
MTEVAMTSQRALIDFCQPESRPAVAQRNVLGFVAFVVLTAILFVRPSDMFDTMETWPIYRAGLLGCLLVLGYAAYEQLRPVSLKFQPITICVLGIALSAILSNAAHGDFYTARFTAVDCLSWVLFYLFLVGCVDSSQRMRRYLLWLLVFIMLVCGLGLLQYHGFIDINAKPSAELEEYIDPDSGQNIVMTRLCSVGIFDNPNDLARIIVVGVILCLWALGDRRFSAARYLWTIPLGLFAYALALTYSRGGFLAMMAAILTLLAVRYGRTKSVILAAIILPILLFAYSGRITDDDVSGGTGQERIKLWRDAFDSMKSAPIFGIGVGEFSDQEGLLVHNSFLQCYTEMGIIGGTIFSGAFYLAVWGPYRLKKYLPRIADPELRRLQPYLLAIMVGSIVGMFSSTRSYRVDTYLLLGLAGAYLRIAGNIVPASRLKFDKPLMVRLGILGIVCVTAFNLYVRVAAR